MRGIWDLYRGRGDYSLGTNDSDSDEDNTINAIARRGAEALGADLLKDLNIKIEGPWEWIETNPNPQVFIEEEKRNKQRLEILNRKLKKFVSTRNISYNLKVVFKRW